jgi:hypothetical protein
VNFFFTLNDKKHNLVSTRKTVLFPENFFPFREIFIMSREKFPKNIGRKFSSMTKGREGLG